MESTQGRALARLPPMCASSQSWMGGTLRAPTDRIGQPNEQVRAHIRALVGTYFDPQLAYTFVAQERSPAGSGGDFSPRIAEQY
jgi:hypothetical protein